MTALCAPCNSQALCHPRDRVQRRPRRRPQALFDRERNGGDLSDDQQQRQQQRQEHSPPPPPGQQREQQQQAANASFQHADLFPQPQQAAKGPLPVLTQRGIPTFQPVIPDTPCASCGGTGRVTCGDCRGKGRLNYRGAAMLPQGVWPQWCPACRASGRWCCAACMGTGVRRAPIGFRLPN